MPTPPQPSAMPAEEFRARVKAAGLTIKGAADVLGVSRHTAQAWAAARASISADKAALIRARLKPE